jgi:hypothetical protein
MQDHSIGSDAVHCLTTLLLLLLPANTVALHTAICSYSAAKLQHLRASWHSPDLSCSFPTVLLLRVLLVPLQELWQETHLQTCSKWTAAAALKGKNGHSRHGGCQAGEADHMLCFALAAGQAAAALCLAASAVHACTLPSALYLAAIHSSHCA